QRACPAIVGSNGPWIEVIFWNRPAAELFGFLMVGSQLDSRWINWSSACHSRPEPQPYCAAIALTIRLTAGEPPVGPDRSPRSSSFLFAESSAAARDLSMNPRLVAAMLLPGNLRVICPDRRLAPLKASATMSAKLMPPPPLPPGTNLPPATGRCIRSLNCLWSAPTAGPP